MTCGVLRYGSRFQVVRARVTFSLRHMCSLKHWKKTTSELDISRMFKLRTGARLCSGRGGTIFIRGHSGPSFNSISTHPVSVSDPRVLLWFNRGCNKHKTLRAKAIMWVGLDRSTYGTGTPLRPGSTFIDGFSKCGTPNFKSPPFLHLLMDFQK